jgi:uncharacterized membrane protein
LQADEGGPVAEPQVQSGGAPLQPTGTIDKNKSRHAITIGRPPDEVFQFFRNFENLALFMKDLDSVDVISPVQSRWKIQLKSGRSIEWLAEVRGEIPGLMISWGSLPGESVQTSGHVTFEGMPGGKKCVVRLSMDFAIPGGKLTEWATFLTGEDPDTLALTNLKRLKQVLETGEFATTEGQPSGREETSTYVVKH